MTTHIDVIMPATKQIYPVVFDPAFARLAASGRPPRDTGTGANSADQPGERLLGKRILIVEDEALVAMELQFAFEDEGAEVVGPAQSLMKALETATHDSDIDLALLDVDIAGENVFPVAELLRRRGVPFAFHTGHASRSELGSLFPGTTTFIKPAMAEALIAHLRKIAR